MRGLLAELTVGRHLALAGRNWRVVGMLRGSEVPPEQGEEFEWEECHLRGDDQARAWLLLDCYNGLLSFLEPLADCGLLDLAAWQPGDEAAAGRLRVQWCGHGRVVASCGQAPAVGQLVWYADLHEPSTGTEYRVDGQGQLWRATPVTPRQWRRARRARGKEE